LETTYLPVTTVPNVVPGEIPACDIDQCNWACICNPSEVNFSFDAHSFWGGRAAGDVMAFTCSRIHTGCCDHTTTLYIGTPPGGPEEWGCASYGNDGTNSRFTINVPANTTTCTIITEKDCD